MKLIKEENFEKLFTINITESELGTILVALNCSNNDFNNNKEKYFSSLKTTEGAFDLYKEVKDMLRL